MQSVMQAILEEMQKLKNEPVEEKELTRSKEHLVGTMLLSLETSHALAGFYGDEEIIEKKLVSPEEIAEKLRKVTAEEIMAIANDIFVDEKLNMTAIGPLKEDPKIFEKILTLQ